jgi:hypothetical protein
MNNDKRKLEDLYDEYSDRQKRADREELFYDVAYTLFVIALFIALVFIFRDQIKALKNLPETTTTTQQQQSRR